MTTYYLNGTPIEEGSDITIGGFTYPYSWLEGTSPSTRASLGIEMTGDINFDQKYYWTADTPKHLDDREEVDRDNNPLYVKVWDPTAGEMVDTDKRLFSPGLKTICTKEVKATANTLLQPTDHYILRHEAEAAEIPADVSTYRAGVISEQERLVTAIAAVTTVEELIAVMSSANYGKME